MSKTPNNSLRQNKRLLSNPNLNGLEDTGLIVSADFIINILFNKLFC